MIKVCETCKRQYPYREKKCPQCGKRLKKRYTQAELEEIRKQNDDMSVVLNMFFM